MELTLRNYSSGDFETLYSIDQDCYPRGIAYSRRTLRWFLDVPGGDCVIAEVRPEKPSAALTVGFIIAEAEGTEGHIITLDVIRDARRTGVGTALLREAERRMSERGVQRVTLETATSNNAAVAFWRRHGYETVGLVPGYYLGRIDAFEMTKNLVTFR